MTVMDLPRSYAKRGVSYNLLGMLFDGWRSMRRQRRERRTLVALSRRDPRLLRDMGFDPEQVYEAMDGSWDEVDPVNYRSHLPRKDRI